MKKKPENKKINQINEHIIDAVLEFENRVSWLIEKREKRENKSKIKRIKNGSRNKKMTSIFLFEVRLARYIMGKVVTEAERK